MATSIADQTKLEPLFFIILRSVPIEEWNKVWPAYKTIMLIMTSKKIRKFLTNNKIYFPTIIHTKKEFWNNNEFWNNIIKSEDVAMIMKIERGFIKMKKMCKITNLKISNLDDEVDISVFSFLISNLIEISQNLFQLDFSNNYNISRYEIKGLIELIKNCPKLESLNLSNIQLNTNKVNMLAKVIPMLTNLTHIDLSHNEILPPQSIVDNGFIYKYNSIKFREFILPKMLSQCQALKHLDLGNNYLGDDGAELLAEALPQCKLVHLNLYRCMISEDGAKALVKTRKQCSTLVYLGLKGNYFCDFKNWSD